MPTTSHTTTPADPTKTTQSLRRSLALLHVRKRDAAQAILMGVIALGSSIALAAVSAWLIARASQMPPVMQLGVATVSVRMFGIARGLFRYLERLASHSVALKGMASLRTEIYAQLSTGKIESISSIRRGDLLARVSKDVDDVGDLVVKGILPGAVAAILSVASIVFVAAFHIPAALALTGFLLLAGIVAPWLAQKAARNTEAQSAAARAHMSALSHDIVTQSAEIVVAGALPQRLAQLARTEEDIFTAADKNARLEGLAQGIFTFSLVASAFCAAALGIPSVIDGSLAPVELAVIVLTPLAVFEVVQGLPAAAIQMHTSRQAAHRIMGILDAAHNDTPERDNVPQTFTPQANGNTLQATTLAVGWPQHTVLTGLNLTLTPGKTIGLVGASGSGKTTTLMTLAGLLTPHAGTVTLNGTTITDLNHHDVANEVIFVSEDSHIFETTVLENLRVARGNVTRDEALTALEQAGLNDWIAQLPQGLDTILGSHAATVSGGERRRLLLARALCSHATTLLIDEPAEHLDPHTADALLTDLLNQSTQADNKKRTVVIATHRLTPMRNADEILMLNDGHVVDRGTHSELVARNTAYREALAAEATTD
ncbi:thiol reductant ABC exporter subunit CydC [Timonella sp. A28]|uniref:thiol reductant ABC exporter subunit CydC n=1 Tax=Timonella sp. A28 TaxID=3442640 RepID=UPI003EBC0812